MTSIGFRFRCGGALLGNSPVYIERQADKEIIDHLQFPMNYIQIIEPRQQGKTSLVNKLMHKPSMNSSHIVYIDITSLDRSTEKDWYETLCPWILDQLSDLIPNDQRPQIPTRSARWRVFLRDIALHAYQSKKRVIIALDEVGAVEFPGATDFFSVIRGAFNSRSAEKQFQWLTFIFAGAFDPRNLIKSLNISPFNIAHRVRIPDFTLEQVHQLVSKGKWTEKQTKELSKRIYYWTDGQPYLIQLLCFYLESEGLSLDVDAAVKRLYEEDENHLSPILDRLERDERINEYLKEEILPGKAIKFNRHNSEIAKLELLGVIKADAEGYCVIRNRIYEQILQPEKQVFLGTGNHWAVLVGVNQYEDILNYSPLQVCVKDVEAIGERLINGGFDSEQIYVLTDNTIDELPNRDNILVRLKSVANNVDSEDLLLFYYSGHGDVDKGESYLVSRNGKRLALQDTAVSVSRIKEILNASPARAKVIVLDACHSGSDIGKKGPKPMSEAFIRRVFEEAEGLAILSSCKQGQVSYEWHENERSVFTHFLLEALESQSDREGKGFVTVQDVNRYVTNGVKSWAKDNKVDQSPTLQYTVAGDIILIEIRNR